jgi:hypothetical protein
MGVIYCIHRPRGGAKTTRRQTMAKKVTVPVQFLAIPDVEKKINFNSLSEYFL